MGNNFICNPNICCREGKINNNRYYQSTTYNCQIEENNNLVSLEYNEFLKFYNVFKTKLINKIKQNQNLPTKILQSLEYEKYVEIYENNLYEKEDLHNCYWLIDERWKIGGINSHYNKEMLGNSNLLNMNIISKLFLKGNFNDLENLIKEDFKNPLCKIPIIFDQCIKYFLIKNHEKKFTKTFFTGLGDREFKEFKKTIIEEIKLYIIEPFYDILCFFYEKPIDILIKKDPNYSKINSYLYYIIESQIFSSKKLYNQINKLYKYEQKENTYLLRKSFKLNKYESILSIDNIDSEFYYNKELNKKDPLNESGMYKTAIDMIKEIRNKHTTLEKIELITKIHNELWKVVHKNNEISPELKQKKNADNSLIMLSFFIFKSKNKYLFEEIQFIEDFCCSQVMSCDEHDFNFNNFQSALKLVISLNNPIN